MSPSPPPQQPNDGSWQVPQGHFLAQQGKAASRLYPHDDEGDYTQQASGSSGTSTSTGGQSVAIPTPLSSVSAPLPDTSTLAGADFDVDVRSGFLPPEAPLARIPDSLDEAVWEQALVAAREANLKIHGGGRHVTPQQKEVHRAWRRALRDMPVIEPSQTMQTDIRYARRGHVVLTFLAHFYIHSQPQPTVDANSRRWWSWSSQPTAEQEETSGTYAARLPPSISIPLLRLSSQLDIPPILTYADTVLWNWTLIDPSQGMRPGNIRICETFSNTPSEEHFFLTSLLIELRGVAALDIMRVCLDECFMGDALAKRRVAKYLEHLCSIVVDLEEILRNVRTHCDPAVFYWGIRPWFRGGDSSPFEQKGWVYPTSIVGDQPAPRLFTGPSAGQSSLIHALDVFMDVDHAGIKPRQNIQRPMARPATTSTAPPITADATTLPPDATFMQRMQLYMPGQHRRFLTHLQSLTADEDIVDDEDTDTLPPTPLRHLASTTLLSNPSHPLPKAYDAALTSLRSLRDEHMRVATLYIISQSRAKPPAEYDMEREEAPNAETEKGTGGTNLVQFLKACRTNTLDALLTSDATL